MATGRTLSARQVNLLLAVMTLGATATGVVSWAVGTGWGRWWTALHAVLGLAVLVLTPLKTSTSVRTGLRRRNPNRWLSVVFGVVVLAAVVIGLLHSVGEWTGVGTWSALWTHLLLGFVAMPLLVWHLVSRPSRPRRADLDRRLLIGGGLAVAGAASVTAVAEGAMRLAGTKGADRRFTGSHEVGSHDPDAMPVVSWFDDTAPTTPTDEWELVVDGSVLPLADLATRCEPVLATLDCTGGWFAEQRWDAVPLADLLDSDAASIEITSSTGYRRIFPMSDADALHLAVGYDRRPLRRGHGGPVRLVAPGRRGYWWVKWIVSVESTDRPAWLQSPFPLS